MVKIIRDYNSNQIVYVDMLDDHARRLVCFEGQGFCRYYVGYRGGKPCEWIYFPASLLPLFEKYKGVRRDRRLVTNYAVKHGLLRPKYLRKLNWRILARVIPDKDVVRFVQSRLGELRVSGARYGDLLGEADRWYPKAMKVLKEGLESLNFLKQTLLGTAAIESGGA